MPIQCPVRPRPLGPVAGGGKACALAVVLGLAFIPTGGGAQTTGIAPIKSRNIGVSREGATKVPRSEGDQAIVDGWPLYRSERGQSAFNDAMATLKATDTASPSPEVFKGCNGLTCNLTLPALGSDGWLPAGRVWVSPSEYVLVAHSPRNRNAQSYRRRGPRDMKYFVLHEFHNSTRNTDAYDTISSHSGSVFVPLYMSKTATDSRGRRFVVVVQVAPHDVVSIHATNRGSAGPGMEVAKSVTDTLEPLQALAGIVVATIIKTGAPNLQVVNHHGSEGMPMLNAYESRLVALRSRPSTPAVALPFVPATPQRVAAATGGISELIARGGGSRPLPVAERGILPPPALASVPTLIGPIRLAQRPAPRGEPTLVAPIRPAVRPAAARSDGDAARR